MADKLVIVESSAKAKTIAKYLGKGYQVQASRGHVRDLPANEFGVDVKHEFEPTYVIMPDSHKIIAGLRKASAKAERVYLAPDPDREGEAIAWHLKAALDLPEEKVRRVTFNEITRTAIRAAFEEPREIDQNLVDAQQTRRILDRIVGYELSPLISKKIVRGLSAGRVQSVALRLIVDREREREAFVPVEYLGDHGRPLPHRRGHPLRGQAGQAERRGGEAGRPAGGRGAGRADPAGGMARGVHRRARQPFHAARALPHQHHAAGRQQPPGLQRRADDAPGAAALRGHRDRRGAGRPDHLHANRLRPGGAAGAGRRAGTHPGDIRGRLPAGEAERLQEPPRRPGRPRGRAPDGRHPHAGGHAPLPERPPVEALRPDLAALRGQPDGAGPLPHDDGGRGGRPRPVRGEGAAHRLRRLHARAAPEERRRPGTAARRGGPGAGAARADAEPALHPAAAALQ